jgi:hypothetical protein
MAERKSVNATIVEEGGKEALAMFGWCMDGHHETCIEGFTGHRCRCGCHTGELVLEPEVEVEVEVDDEKE